MVMASVTFEGSRRNCWAMDAGQSSIPFAHTDPWLMDGNSYR